MDGLTGCSGVEGMGMPERSRRRRVRERRRRLMKVVAAANRCAPNMDELASQAAAWLAALFPNDRLRCSGLLSTTFHL
jgi:hypothetical protein